MGKYYDEIPQNVTKWIMEQKVFWVATAPLSEDGLVNLSPKGVEGTFHIIDRNRVWYEDLTGSGVSTVAHVREYARITIMFNAFEGPPRILRLFGKGTVHEFGSPEYNALLPREKRTEGSRAIIMIDVFKVGTSCGFGVPFYTYKAPRNRLLSTLRMFEKGDIEGQKGQEETAAGDLDPQIERMLRRGLKNYWRTSNAVNLDGLPALLTACESKYTFRRPEGPLTKDDERVGQLEIGRQEESKVSNLRLPEIGASEGGIILSFLAGAFAHAIYVRWFKGMITPYI